MQVYEKVVLTKCCLHDKFNKKYHIKKYEIVYRESKPMRKWENDRTTSNRWKMPPPKKKNVIQELKLVVKNY